MKASFYQEALATVWADPGIVTITPFLYNAGDGPFKGFSFLKQDGSPTALMDLFLQMPKVAGKPGLPPYVLGIEKHIFEIPAETEGFVVRGRFFPVHEGCFTQLHKQ